MEDLLENEACMLGSGFRALSPASAEGTASERPAGERILAAARDLFCRDGIHATGIDRILAAAGASKMALYARFGSKDALVQEVLLREGAAWREAFFAELEQAGPDPMAQLLAVVPALGAWFGCGRFYGCSFMNAAAEHSKGEPQLRAMAVEHHRLIRERITAIAEAAGVATPAKVARQIMLLMDGVIASLMVAGDPGVLEVAGENLRGIVRQA